MPESERRTTQHISSTHVHITLEYTPLLEFILWQTSLNPTQAQANWPPWGQNQRRGARGGEGQNIVSRSHLAISFLLCLHKSLGWNKMAVWLGGRLMSATCTHSHNVAYINTTTCDQIENLNEITASSPTEMTNSPFQRSSDVMVQFNHAQLISSHLTTTCLQLHLSTRSLTLW